MKYSSARIAVVILILLCTVSIDVAWKHYLENSARITARYNLEQTKVCVNDLLLQSADSPIYNTHITNDDIEKALKTCARKMRVTPTGDMFAYSLRTLDFIFDPSLDCYVEGGKKMTADSECSIHKDPQVCKQAMTIMNTGYDSDEYLKVWWKFDDAREYLEWVILPSETIGFDGVFRGGILKPNQVLVAQGVQEDELWARYAGLRIFVYGVGFVSILLNLFIALHESTLDLKKEGMRDEQCQ
jgi:hypothetical protein